MTENARKLAETCRQFVASGGPGGAARGAPPPGGPPPLSLQEQLAALQPRTSAPQPPQPPQPQPPQQAQAQQPPQQGVGAAPEAAPPLPSVLPPSIDPVALRAALACLGGAAARLPASLAADLATAERAPQATPQLAPPPGDSHGAAREPTSCADGGGLPPEPPTTCEPSLSTTAAPECDSALGLGNEDESVHVEPAPLKVQRTA
jgi:hypothetical protein